MRIERRALEQAKISAEAYARITAPKQEWLAMSEISQDRWMKEAQAELAKALAAVEASGIQTPETRLLQVLAVAVDGLLDITRDQVNNSGYLHYMPSEYVNGRRWTK